MGKPPDSEHRHCTSSRTVRDASLPCAFPTASLTLRFDAVPLRFSPRPCVRGFSSCFGATSTGGRDAEACVSIFTRRLERELKELNSALRALHDFPKDFEFTSLQLGRNHDVHLHEDEYNVGPSVVLAWGPYEGGRFILDGVPHVVNGNCFLFDGRVQHEVEAYHPRDRRSLVAFSHPAAARLGKDDHDLLARCGFPLPRLRSKESRSRCVEDKVDKPRLIPAEQTRDFRQQGDGASSSLDVRGGKRPCLKASQDLAGVRIHDFIAESADALQDRLVSLRRCTYRGVSQLPLSPWRADFRGAVLIIDLFAGVSGALVAAATLDVDMFAVVVEDDLGLLESQRSSFPDALLVSDIKLIRSDVFAKFIERRSITDILIVAGPPCQPNSRMNPDSAEFEDPRAPLADHVLRIQRDFLSLPGDAQVHSILEAPVGREAFRKRFQDQFGKPVGIDAGVFGWVRRSRLYFATCRGMPLLRSKELKLPQGFTWHERAMGDDGFKATSVKYEGKPVPAQVHYEEGFKLLVDPKAVVRDDGRGAIAPFTRDFPHFGLSQRPASKEARGRAKLDGHSFADTAYERHCLLWKAESWRVPGPAVRAQLHGMPPSTVLALAPMKDQMGRRRIQNSAVGNGFHVPSLALVILLISQAAKAAYVDPPFADPDEVGLKLRVEGTVFDQSIALRHPALMSALEVIDDIQDMLGGDIISAEAWALVRRGANDRQEDVARLQSFWLDCEIAGCHPQSYGPEWILERDRGGALANFGVQRALSTSKKGLPAALPPGLGPTRHLELARRLSSPFSASFDIDSDLAFTAKALVLLGPALEHWRFLQSRAIQRTASWLRPLEEAAVSAMDPSVAKVAASKRPAFIALLTSVLRWPDRLQPCRFIQGFRLIGQLDHSCIFRDILPDPEAIPEERFFGEEAVEFNERIAMQPPPKRDVDKIYASVVDEIEKGNASDWLDAADLDEIFGVGRWRGQPRFIHTQGSGKERPIDNAKKTLANSAIEASETIFAPSLSFVPAFIRLVIFLFLSIRLGLERQAITALDWSAIVGLLPEWLRFGLALEDWAEAYRQDPVFPAHAGAAVTAAFDIKLKRWRYVRQHGTTYGLSAAVTNFCRLPTLTAAAVRRITAVAMIAYFDDNIVVDVLALSDSGPASVRNIYAKEGVKLSPSKSTPLKERNAALGNYLDFSEIVSCGILHQDVLDACKGGMVAMMQEALDSDVLEKNDTGKLRGSLQWASSREWGKCGRMIMGPLVVHQFHRDSSRPSQELRDALELMISILSRAPSRRVSVCPQIELPILVYSDAAFGDLDDGLPGRAGWIAISPGGVMRAYFWDLSPEKLEALSEKETHIALLEALPAVFAVLSLGEFLRGKPVIWFVDNQGSASSLVKGSSSDREVNRCVILAQWLWAYREILVWLEWVDSASNISDGVSRYGMRDPYLSEQGILPAEFAGPPLSELFCENLSDAIAFLENW